MRRRREEAPVRTWRDVPGWFDFDDIYDEAVEERKMFTRPVRFVEIGVCFGRSAIYLATLIRDRVSPGSRFEFDAIDGWEPGHVPEFPTLRALADAFGGVRGAFEWYAGECGVRDRINVVQSRSLDPALLARYAPGSLDLVFLDTSHTYADTCAEIEAWLPKVRPGGVFAGHDWVSAYPGIARALAERLPGAVRRRSSFFWRVPG